MRPSPLLTGVDSQHHVHLILGTNPLANTRCAKSLEVGATPIVIAPPDSTVHYLLEQRIQSGQVRRIERSFEDADLISLGREEIDHVVDAVFITSAGKDSSNTRISQLCRRQRIPINVVDAPDLCTFTILSTHSDGPLQIGVTTSGNGCKLASRIRREIATSLPLQFGDTVERLGAMRRRIIEEDHKNHDTEDLNGELEDTYATAQRPTFNRLVSEDDLDAAKTRRMRWLAQICEYWPLKRLSDITDADIGSILQSYRSGVDASMPSSSSRQSTSTTTEILTEASSTSNIPLDHPVLDSHRLNRPRIYLAGSGPGSPDLLTLATHRAIQTASVILADKLVPEAVLNLIPRRTPVHIARKFPGNADAAQEELLNLGLDSLRRGLTVLRLKQGDPYLYGRGGEEYSFFASKGYTPIVLPGITSAFAAPLLAAIPATHRAVADQVLVCTGTGRKGAAPDPPPYVRSQTVVFLMALHRLPSLVESLVGGNASTGTDSHPKSETQLRPDKHHPLLPNGTSNHSNSTNTPDTTSRSPPPHVDKVTWPPETPCAVIERASCRDQRIIRSTLGNICRAIDEEGSRPPGLLVVGWSCGVLKPEWAGKKEREGAEEGAGLKGEGRANGAGKEREWVVEEGFDGFGIGINDESGLRVEDEVGADGMDDGNGRSGEGTHENGDGQGDGLNGNEKKPTAFLPLTKHANGRASLETN